MDGEARTWREAFAVYFEPRVVAVTLLGFSSGLPLLLVFGTLSYWLAESGVSKTAIGVFSLVRTPYTFKFLWAPLVDRVRVPWLADRLGQRRAWALTSQALLALSILALGSSRPAEAPLWTAICAVFVAFFSATQDIVVDAFRIESLEESRQGAGAGAYVVGYRVGMLAAGAGALVIAENFDWTTAYAAMAASLSIGVLAILCSSEPERGSGEAIAAGFGARLRQMVVDPFADFAERPKWVLILLFIMLYKLGDAYLGVMANPFYYEMGFTKTEIAGISKTFGFACSLVGGLAGGVVVAKLGIRTSLLVCGVAQMLSNLVFAVQAMVGHDVGMLVVTIAVENLTGAMATSAFVAYLSILCSTEHTATQYALLSSFMAFARDVLSGSSGWAATQLGWIPFFVATTGAAIPGLLLLLWLPAIRKPNPPPSD